ncbi:sugar phosphate isomerase/epimerase family protein [Aureibacillus halotolerans]|uniref:Sugar phosphate isomerase/epimerase n=1 Tax=Aureibacillus halotolerans TaxID=1508390 RepID=A0A4R6U2Z1_9BACI|nr:sugar phosphate isomerase/epimerase [Aureibacillus halotolerans]TDQ39113.1 sugar phosphate isomerase/epimerase [Aureibacillus halotolerans]
MINKGFTSNLWVWSERFKLDGREWDLETCLNECAQSGLNGIELNADQLEGMYKQVQSAGLAVSASYIGLELHKEGLGKELKERILPIAEQLVSLKGTDLLVNADADFNATTAFKTEDDFKRQGEHLSMIAELLEPYKLNTAMHNHAAIHEHAVGDLRAVTAYSSPSVGLCVDTGWALTSGCNPQEWVEKYPEKVFAVHLRNQFGSVPTEDLIEGDISMPAFIDALKAAQYEGWISLELWHRKDTNAERTMLEDYRLSIDYLNTLIQA